MSTITGTHGDKQGGGGEGPEPGHGHAHPKHLAHHFDTPKQQYESGKTGMWLFLATEILLFSGLFCAYAAYRANHPEIFIYAHQYLDKTLGGINTIVLILSSLTAAWAVRAAQLGQRRLLIGLVVATLVCAAGFMGIKAVEYNHKWKHGLLWGTRFHPETHEATPGEGTHGESMPGEGTSGEGTSGEGTPAGGAAAGGHDGTATTDGHTADAAGAGDGAVTDGGHRGGAAVDGTHPGPVEPVPDAVRERYTGVTVVAGQVYEAPPVVRELSPEQQRTLHSPDEAIHNEEELVDAGREGTMGSGAHAPTTTAPERATVGTGGTPGAAPERDLHAGAGAIGGANAGAGGTSDNDLNIRTSLAPPGDGPVGLASIGALPGGHGTETMPKNVQVFFGIYFTMTGLHAIHVLAGMIAFVWILVRAVRGEFGRDYFAPVDLVALYWHVVDLVWIFLFPLLYLIH